MTDERAGERMSAGTLARGTMHLLIARAVFLGSGFVISVILGRTLGPVAFGVYGVVITTLTWFERVLSAGIPGAAATLIPRHEAQREVLEQSARVLLCLLALPVFGLLWVMAPALADYFEIPTGATLIRVAALNIPAMSLFFAYEGILSGRRLFHAQGMLLIVQSTAKLIGIAILILIGVTVAGALIVHVLASALAVIAIWFAYPWGRQLPSREMMATVLRVALPVGVYLISLAAMHSLSLWQLKSMTAPEDAAVGQFVASLYLTRLLQVIPATVSVVLYSSMSWAVSNSEHELTRRYLHEAGRFALVASTPLGVLLAADAAGVLGLLFGNDYAAGSAILIYLCVAFVCSTLLDLWAHALMAHGNFRLPVILVVCLLPALYALNVLLIGRAGAVGAALASAIVFGGAAAAAGWFVYRRIGSLLSMATVVRVLIAGFLIAALSIPFPASGLWLLLKLAGLSVLYLAILWGSGEISKHDLVALPFLKPGKS